MIRMIAISLFIFLCQSISSRECLEKSVKTSEIQNRDYYPYVYFVTCGENIPADTAVSDEYEGYFFRVETTISEIYKTIIIEKISYGIEGFYRKIQSVRRIDEDDFSEKFGYSLGMIVNFEFLGWKSPTSFICKIHDDIFEISDIDQADVRIIRFED